LGKLSSFRSALVTGGRSGIGAALVAALEREGVAVEVLDLVDGFDVSDQRAWEQVGPVDLACLNAGVTTGEGNIASVTDEQYRRILGANVDGVVYGVRRLARVMQPGSSIVVTASLAGLTTLEIDPVYGGTKHFAVGFVRSVAPQLADRGITINAVCPGIVDTPILGDTRDQVVAAEIEMLQPSQVADAILTAARDGSTGEAWVCLPGRPLERHAFHRFFESA
jgi:NAD(P)-dependent dehydrogenase (short-subunit alcohol dehydrogenase family)